MVLTHPREIGATHYPFFIDGAAEAQRSSQDPVTAKWERGHWDLGLSAFSGYHFNHWVMPRQIYSKKEDAHNLSGFKCQQDI